MREAQFVVEGGVLEAAEPGVGVDGAEQPVVDQPVELPVEVFGDVRQDDEGEARDSERGGERDQDALATARLARDHRCPPCQRQGVRAV